MPTSPFVLLTPEAQLAAELRRRLRAGEYGEKIPGILRLVKIFGVSRSIVEAAVGELVDTGEIVTAGPGKAMRPGRRGDHRGGLGSLILYDLPRELRSGDAAEAIEAVAAVLPGPVTRLQLDSNEPPEKHLVHLRLLKPEATVVMHHRAAMADALIEAGHRVIALGTAGVPKKAAYLATGHEKLVKEALRRAFAAGHTRVCVPLWRRKPEIAERMRGWIAAAYAEAGLRHSPEFDAPFSDGDTPEAMRATVRELFRHTPPTALILSDFPQWLATFCTLASLRRRVPEDVSLIMLAHSPELDAVAPSQAHFRHPVERFAPEIRRLLRRRPGDPPPPLYLDPVWVPGDSLAPPTK